MKIRVTTISKDLEDTRHNGDRHIAIPTFLQVPANAHVVATPKRLPSEIRCAYGAKAEPGAVGTRLIMDIPGFKMRRYTVAEPMQVVSALLAGKEPPVEEPPAPAPAVGAGAAITAAAIALGWQGAQARQEKDGRWCVWLVATDAQVRAMWHFAVVDGWPTEQEAWEHAALWPNRGAK